jgi:hypothetical protein
MAYHQVFNPNNVYTKDVLKDLAAFCRAHESCFHPNENVANMLKGRREVWLRIQQYLNMTDQELYEFHKIRSKEDGN